MNGFQHFLFVTVLYQSVAGICLCKGGVFLESGFKNQIMKTELITIIKCCTIKVLFQYFWNMQLPRYISKDVHWTICPDLQYFDVIDVATIPNWVLHFPGKNWINVYFI